MNIILLQVKLTHHEINHLFKEFPQFLYLSFSTRTYKELSKDQWQHVEIVYGDRLSKEELAMAPQLRWIHSPSPHLNRLCLKEIVNQGNILITTTKKENLQQIGEYVMSGILAFGKNLFHWKQADQDPRFLWDSKWRDSMWELKGKQLLQIGLGTVGTEVARQASQMGMQVIGAEERRSFHAHCLKTMAFEDLDAALPQADVVCLALPLNRDYENWFDKRRLDLMKEDSVLIVIGASNVVNENDLVKISETSKLRGVMIDSFYQIPIPQTSPLWKIPNIIITPEVSPRPKSEEKQSFQLFRYNLRQYLYGNFAEMRNVIDETLNLVSKNVPGHVELS